MIDSAACCGFTVCNVSFYKNINL